MKCNKGTDLVCTYWNKCQNANICENVPKGIRNKLEREVFSLQLVRKLKKSNNS